MELSPGALTIFVGPNNSGKSMALRDIQRYVTTSNPKGSRILRRVHRRLPRGRLRRELLSRLRKELAGWIPREAQLARDSNSSEIARAAEEFIPSLASWLSLPDLLQKRRLDLKSLAALLQVALPSSDALTDFNFAMQLSSAFGRWLNDRHREGQLNRALLQLLRKRVLSYEVDAQLMEKGTILLDGKGRLSTVEPTGVPQFQVKERWDKNHLVDLLEDDEARDELRRIVHDAIGLYPVIDVTNYQRTVLKLSERAPPTGIERRNDPQAIQFFRRAKDIQELSDGVKSFTGLLATVLSNHYQLMLIDEPEAFLHPSLARKLGYELHRLARKRRGHLIAATHSAEFVTGCLQAGHDVNIVRLTYREGTPTARLLPMRSLQQVMREPLLRSTRVLSALSHVGAVICEGDSDRAFYQMINDRLLDKGEGLSGCIFLNAHSKQAIHKLLGPLHAIGLPVAAIVDCDLIGAEDDHQKLLGAVGGEQLINTIGTAKSTLFQAFQARVPDAELVGLNAEAREKKRREKARTMLKEQGIRALDPAGQKAARTTFIEPLARYGIFVVPVGELESWLEELFAGGEPPTKGEWFTAVLDRMGSDPESPKYLGPSREGEDDVWDFMRRVARWLSGR